MAGEAAAEEPPRFVRWMLVGMLSLALVVEESMDLRRGRTVTRTGARARFVPDSKARVLAPARGQCHVGTHARPACTRLTFFSGCGGLAHCGCPLCQPGALALRPRCA